MSIRSIPNYFYDNSELSIFPHGDIGAINDSTFISCLHVRVLTLLT